MREFMEILPVIWWPLIYGGLVIGVFRATHSPTTFKDIKLRWLISYDVGYVAWNFEQSFVYLKSCEQFEMLRHIVMMILLCVLSYAVGRVFNANWFEKLLHKLHIAADPSADFWDALQDMEVGTYIYVTVPQDKIAASGTLAYLETETTQPQIAICQYCTYDISDGIDRCDRSSRWMGRLMDDYSEDFHRLFVIDLKKCGHVEIRYPDESKKMV